MLCIVNQPLSNYLYFFIHLDDESTVFNRVGVEAYICESLSDDSTTIDWFPRDGDNVGDLIGGYGDSNKGDAAAGGGGGGGTDGGGGGGGTDGGDSAAFAFVSNDGDGFDLEDTFEKQGESINQLRSSVEVLRQQNETVSRNLAALRHSLDVRACAA